MFSLRGWVKQLLFTVLFVVILFFAAGGYRWLVDAISPIHPYQLPKGESLKVFLTDPDSPDSSNGMDRLRWFYWYGE